MVQKFTFWRTQMDAGMKPAAEIGETFYLCSDMDARIGSLESLLEQAIHIFDTMPVDGLSDQWLAEFKAKASSLMDLK